MRLLERWLEINDKISLLNCLEPAGEQVTEIVSVKDHKRFLTVTYGCAFRKEARSMNVVYQRNVGRKKADWLRTNA